MKSKKWYIVGAVIVFLAFIGMLIDPPKETQNSTTPEKKTTEEQKPEKSEDAVRIGNIKSSVKDGICSYNYEPPKDTDFISSKAAYSGAITQYLHDARELFKDGACTRFDASWKIYTTDNDGNENNDRTLMMMQISPEQYASYEWDSLEGEAIGQRLYDDEVILNFTGIDKVELKDVKLNKSPGRL